MCIRDRSVINSGYGNYGANLTKKSMRGWEFYGGSPKEDIEDNINVPVSYTHLVRKRKIFLGKGSKNRFPGAGPGNSWGVKNATNGGE